MFPCFTLQDDQVAEMDSGPPEKSAMEGGK